jgi:hypothetical protein
MDSADVNSIERMMVDFKDEIKTEFRHQLGIQSEAFQCKLDLVVEGHQMLVEKLDLLAGGHQTLVEKLDHVDERLDHIDERLDHAEERLDGRIDRVDRKLDAIFTDLAAHRRDTEAHPPLYKVKED